MYVQSCVKADTARQGSDILHFNEYIPGSRVSVFGDVSEQDHQLMKGVSACGAKRRWGAGSDLYLTGWAFQDSSGFLHEELGGVGTTHLQPRLWESRNS